MALSDQAPDSIRVRDRVGGRPVAGVAFGAVVGTSDFIQWVQDAQLQTRFGYDAANGDRLEYIGFGKPGAVITDAAWIIKRFFYVAAGADANIDRIVFAALAGDPTVGVADFVHVWNDRTSLSYPS